MAKEADEAAPILMTSSSARVLAEVDVNAAGDGTVDISQEQKAPVCTPRSLRRITSAQFECVSSEAFCKVSDTAQAFQLASTSYVSL
eukprot:scaffold947_cov375-Prasinococcus_capsulatus_cf.AAC.2